MLELKKKGNVKIDGQRDLELSLAILKHVANDSRIFNDDESTRKLDAFKDQDPTRVFLHYVNLIDAHFIAGYHNIQEWKVVAYYLTWEGHELLDRLENQLKQRSGIF